MKTYVLAAAVSVIVLSCNKVPRTAKLPPTPQRVESDEDASPRDALEYYIRRRLPEGETRISPEWALRAQQQIAMLPKARLATLAGASLPWTQAGPGNIGGRIRSILINPSNPNIMYVGAVTGGVWKTINGGANWTILTDTSAVITVGHMVMDPTNPNVIYAGTGESYQGYAGQGIYKSTDGNTFTVLSSTANANFAYVNKLAIGHGSPQHIYAATTNGLWASMDGGTTWNRQITANVHGCDDVQARTDVSTDYLYATCGGATPSAGYIVYRNTDAGGSGTWANVLSNPAMERTSIAIAPSQQSTVYAIAASNGSDIAKYKDGLQAVYRSQSNGDAGTWTTQTSNSASVLMNTSVLSNPLCTAAQKPYNVGWYANVIAVDPTNPNRLWAGASEIYRSDDGGVTWNVASLSGSHVDNHVFAFAIGYDGSANQSMYLGNDGGIFRSDNAMATLSGPSGNCNSSYPMTWKSLDNSFVATQFYDGAPFPGGSSYFGGTQDNGILRGNDTGGVNGWSVIYGGDGGFVAVDPADASTMFMDNNSMSFHRSTDGGGSTPLAMNGIPSTETGLFIVPFAMDPNDGMKLWLGAQSALYRTVDGANTWTVAAPQPSGSTIFVSAVAVSPFDSNSVIFGATDGKIYRNTNALTSNGSTAWASAQPRSTTVSWIAFDPNNRGVVYATYSAFRNGTSVSHIYKSSDGGASWSGIDGTGASALPDTPIHTIVVDPLTSSTLYVGSDTGMFISRDGGATWTHDASPFANAVIYSLRLDRAVGGSVLFAFTFGRGVWKTPLANAPAGCTYGVSPTTISAPANGGLFPVTVTTGAGCAWVVDRGSSFAAGQAPASGTGSGTAVVSVAPNFGTKALSSSSLQVAGTPISISQSNPSLTAEGPSGIGVDERLSAPARSLPYTGVARDTRTLTANPSDPVHTCTNSADFKTAWWQFTAPSTGMMEVTAQSERWDDPGGNAGFVLTAYPAGSPATGSELGCTTVPRDTFAWVSSKIRFAVSAGSNYVIEVSATGNTANDGGYTLVFASMGAPDFAVSVSPSNAAIGPGGTLQFNANDTSSVNPAVRWSISPAFGLISPSGHYTAPPVVGAATKVLVTATAFADPSKQSTAAMTVFPTAQIPPAPTGVTPTSGTTNSATFSMTFSDPAGLQTLQVVDMLLNNALDGRHACYVAFVPSSNSVFLVDDAGDAGGPYQGMVLPGSSTISNSQCTVNGTGSSVSTSGTTLTLALAVTFKSAFAGNKVVYLSAQDQVNGSSGWQALATWAVPSFSFTGPGVGGVGPAHTSSLGPTNYTFTFTDTNGWQDLGVLNVLINSAIDGRSGCYIAFVPSNSTVFLVDDAGDAGGPYSMLTLPANGSVSNSQCSVFGQNSSVSASGSTLTLNLSMSFTQGFAGNRIVYMAARSNTANSDWQAAGTIGVP